VGAGGKIWAHSVEGNESYEVHQESSERCWKGPKVLWGSLGFLCKLAQHLLVWVYISEIVVIFSVTHLMVIKKEGKR
jgi:hypothetical protein